VQIARDDCPVCGTVAGVLPSITSDFSQMDFEMRRCDGCGLTFVGNPRVDFERLYDAEYYAGRGADRFVDYLNEMENPDTIREYEWRGIFKAVTSIVGHDDVRWLDYGCGLGGLVRYVRSRGMTGVVGHEDGWSVDWMREHGLPVLDRQELNEWDGKFDVVTAIEVIEHLTDPVAVVANIASLLRPGGLFFLTTGNAEPHRGRFADWAYVHPDVHVTYFEPRTLVAVYQKAGLEPYRAGFLPGYEDIIRYKVLRTLRLRSRNVVERLVPWKIASRVVDRRYRVTSQPLGRRGA
jgi:2-polyprenyl-3-methyl-5-hydroxy-6-metoxy-1,4-benzoquinol methylase